MSILLIDSYDSFTNNLKHLVQTATGAQVLTIHNDSYTLPADERDLTHLISQVDAVIVGPGPGSPNNKEDIGVISYVYEHFPQKPILGICLGFQTLCLHYGGQMGYLTEPIHGQIHSIGIVDHADLFKGFPDSFESVRYHSIYIKDSEGDSQIKPLAYHVDETTSKKVLMAARHVANPHFGVQYHPESICSTWGEQLVKNFWSMCAVGVKESSVAELIKDKHILKNEPFIKQYQQGSYEYQFEEIHVSSEITILDICDEFHKSNQDTLLLNSAFTPGEWSIIGLPIKGESDVLTHSTEKNSEIAVSKWGDESTNKAEQSDNIFQFIAQYMSERYYKPEISDSTLAACPFAGGLIGYMSYEEGQFIQLEKLEKMTNSPIDDTKLCFIERFIALNTNHDAFVVSIKPSDSQFIKETIDTLSKVEANQSSDLDISQIKATTPNKDAYFKAFHKSQEYLKSGDSYELCLTCPTTLKFPKGVSSWELYKSLVKKNPSPYSAFLDFGSSNLLSTSPERFISWDEKSCQMRPIKGTLKKAPKIDFAEAERRLKIPKEMGENLMIVDLIRHDLFTLLDSVTVDKLMSVEEYHTLYQLVSVIQGQFQGTFKGIDVLSHCLPPGSMTGAPKKRSVELLHDLEHNKRRGLYSGVCGYYSVNDVADWSVIIRSIFSYEDDLLNDDQTQIFRCGAGGALTVLSTDEGEWDEMHVKFDSVLQLFK